MMETADIFWGFQFPFGTGYFIILESAYMLKDNFISQP